MGRVTTEGPAPTGHGLGVALHMGSAPVWFAESAEPGPGPDVGKASGPSFGSRPPEAFAPILIPLELGEHSIQDGTPRSRSWN